jgi:hypothetical protein
VRAVAHRHAEELDLCGLHTLPAIVDFSFGNHSGSVSAIVQGRREVRWELPWRRVCKIEADAETFVVPTIAKIHNWWGIELVPFGTKRRGVVDGSQSSW